MCYPMCNLARDSPRTESSVLMKKSSSGGGEGVCDLWSVAETRQNKRREREA